LTSEAEGVSSSAEATRKGEVEMKRLAAVTFALFGVCVLTAVAGAPAAGGQPIHYTLLGTAEWSSEPLVET
jgi:hypothetical protein